MPQSLLLLRDKSGNPKRFAIRCGFEDKERVKRAGSGCARWSSSEKVWTIPPDPVLLKQMMDMFPQARLMPDLQDYLGSLYDKQQKMYLATGIEDPISDDCKLLPYQNSSVRVLDVTGNLILGHDMGLGKTPITCVAIDYVSANRAIVVCPSSVKWLWVDHLIEWAYRDDLYVLESKKVSSDLATVIYRNRDDELLDLLASDSPAILLMSYDMLRIHQQVLTEFDYDVIVFDEAHRLKNRKAPTTQAAMSVSKTCARRWYLTGTPIRNHYTDVYTLLSMIDPPRFGSYWNFVNTYLDTVPNVFGGIDIVGLKNEEEFNSMLSVYMYRLTKAEVMDQLPPKIYTDLKLPMNNEQQKIYDQMEKEMIVSFEQQLDDGVSIKEIVSAPNTVSQIIRLRQICLCPSLIGGPEDSAKIDTLAELIEDLLDKDERMIVFTYFRKFLKRIESLLDHLGVPYGQIVGGQSSSDRYNVQKGLTEGKYSIVIGTAQSMGEGMNLQAASTAIFCDIDWVPANNLQAEDRVHRGLIKSSPNIIKLHHPNTVETDIRATCRRKEDITDRSIGSVETIRNMLLRKKVK